MYKRAERGGSVPTKKKLLRKDQTLALPERTSLMFKNTLEK
jgi:hypothetical protein